MVYKKFPSNFYDDFLTVAVETVMVPHVERLGMFFMSQYSPQFGGSIGWHKCHP